jgi:hypothetical protein
MNQSHNRAIVASSASRANSDYFLEYLSQVAEDPNLGIIKNQKISLGDLHAVLLRTCKFGRSSLKYIFTQRPTQQNSLDIVTEIQTSDQIVHHVKTGFFMDPFEKKIEVTVYDAWNALIEVVPMFLKPTNDITLTRFNELIYVCVLNQYINGDNDGQAKEAPETLRKSLYSLIYTMTRTSTRNSETAFLQDQVALLSDNESPYEAAIAEMAFRDTFPTTHHICTAMAEFEETVERHCIETFRQINVDELLKDEDTFPQEMTDRENKARLQKFFKLTQKYAVQVNDIFAKPKHFPVDLYFDVRHILASPTVYPTGAIKTSSVFLNLRAIANARNKTEMRQLTKDKNISNQIRDFIKVCTIEDVNSAFVDLAPKTMNEEDPGKRPKFLSDPAVLSMYLEKILHEKFVSGAVCRALAGVCMVVNKKFRDMPRLAEDQFNQSLQNEEKDPEPQLSQMEIEAASEVGGVPMSVGRPLTPALNQGWSGSFDASFIDDEQGRLQRFSDDREVDMLYRRAFKFEEEEEMKTSLLPFAIGAAAIVLFVIMKGK